MMKHYTNIWKVRTFKILLIQTNRLNIMDNEASDFIKQTLTRKIIKDQLFPPHIHSNNTVDITIRTLKNIFIAGLPPTHTTFPIH